MKKLLLLSIAASAVLFAGGDIKEVVVPEETPVVPCPTSNLKWYGQTVLYYQTQENINAVSDNELFDGDVSKANAGIKLGVTGSNLLDTGLGFGVEVVALGSLGLEKDGDTIAVPAPAGFVDGGADGIVNDYVSDTMQRADETGNDLNGGELTQAYLTYTAGNTTAKVGRMYLPKSLSPFAFSEKWNVFSNSFEAALLINSDLPDTTLVGAWVARANGINNLGAWNDMGANNNGIFMLTAQNKSVAGLTLTGTVYYGSEAGVILAGNTVGEDLVALWADAKFSTKVAGNTINIGVQGGTIDTGASDTTIAYGVKAGGKFAIPAFGNVALCAAYTGVDLQNSLNGVVDAGVSVQNLGTGVKTPLYTQMVGNQNYISGFNSDNGEANTYMVKASATYDLPALGNVSFAVAYSGTEIVSPKAVPTVNTNDFNELDVIAKTKLGDATVLAAYVNQTQDDSLAGVATNEIDTDIVRVWAKWDF
ncbi:hypothetical protein MNB_SV-15-1175 [hydrothermal vent metagenome]|uniref:Porin domain-containing protein n=1 Tax=hydrothermal vent metagenome TaxID=652676 RepID=A0A1W1EHZ0_9ZZZZ